MRILHRNHLLKCDQPPLGVFDEDELDIEKKPKEKKARKEKKEAEAETPAQPSAPTQVVDAEDGDSEEGDVGIAVYENVSRDQPVELLEPVDTVPDNESVVAPEEAETMLDETDVAEEAVVEENEPEAEEEEHGEESEPEETSSDSEEETAVRRTARTRKPRKVMTFDEVGGAPSWEVVGSG